MRPEPSLWTCPITLSRGSPLVGGHPYFHPYNSAQRGGQSGTVRRISAGQRTGADGVDGRGSPTRSSKGPPRSSGSSSPGPSPGSTFPDPCQGGSGESSIVSRHRMPGPSPSTKTPGRSSRACDGGSRRTGRGSSTWVTGRPTPTGSAPGGVWPASGPASTPPGGSTTCGTGRPPASSG